jgi:hypothetical protein
LFAVAVFILLLRDCLDDVALWLKLFGTGRLYWQLLPYIRGAGRGPGTSSMIKSTISTPEMIQQLPLHGISLTCLLDRTAHAPISSWLARTSRQFRRAESLSERGLL